MIRTAISVVTPPSVEPISLIDAKAWLRVDDSIDDSVIDGLIVAAREKVETDTGRRLITQTIDQTMDALPCSHDPIVLMTGPSASITSITTYDTDDQSSIVDPGTYFLDASRAPARIILNADESWPTDLRCQVAAVIRAVAGYGVAGTDVPEALRLALRLLLTDWYEGGCDPKATSAGVCRAYDALIWPYRLEWVS